MRLSRPLFLAAAVLLAATPAASHAQYLQLNPHGAVANGVFDAPAYGIGYRVGVDWAPVRVLAAVDLFAPDCGGCSLRNLALEADLTVLPLVFIEIYLTGGATSRTFDLSGVETTAGGYSLGAGARYPPIRNAFIEARSEFFANQDGGSQTVIRIGFTLVEFWLPF